MYVLRLDNIAVDRAGNIKKKLQKFALQVAMQKKN